MKKHAWRQAAAAGVVFAAIALPRPVLAQNLHQHGEITGEQLTEADKLFDEAVALIDSCDHGEWLKAAGLFLKSAKLRPCHDPKVFQARKEAALLYYYLGDYEKAHATLRGAAAHALGVGALPNAAQAYVEAAYAAVRLGLADEAMRYVAAAEDISRSPFLGSETGRLVHLVPGQTADVRKR